MSIYQLYIQIQKLNSKVITRYYNRLVALALPTIFRICIALSAFEYFLQYVTYVALMDESLLT